LVRQVPVLEKVVAVLIRQNGIVQMDFGKARNGAQNNVFDAGLGRRGD
jgi:hypothetical protein